MHRFSIGLRCPVFVHLQVKIGLFITWVFTWTSKSLKHFVAFLCYPDLTKTLSVWTVTIKVIHFSVADLEGVQGVRSKSKPPFKAKLFHFHGDLFEKLGKTKKTNPP